MRKLSALILATSICFALCGCSDGDIDNTTVNEQTTSAFSTTTQLIKEEPVPDEPEPAPVHTTSIITEQTTTVSAIPETADAAVEEQDIYSVLVNAYDNEYLGLPQKNKVYIFADSDAFAEINGELCHAVSCYDEYEGTLYYMCDYYVTENGDKVYRYYEAEERFQLLPEGEEELFPGLDPTTQTPEEIFAVANELYRIFDKPNLECDRNTFFDVEGNGRYYLLLDERFDTMQELLDALNKYFSTDLVNAFMDSNQFRVGEDGRMYYLDCAWGSNIAYLGTEYELTSLSEDEAVYTAYSTFEYEAGAVEEIEITYNVKKQYGVWRFVDYANPENP